MVIKKAQVSRGRHITAPISISYRGTGYINDPDIKQDVLVSTEALNTALNRDIVLVLVHPKKPNTRLTGEVIRVIERAKTQFVGVVEKKNGIYIVVPDDRRMYATIALSPSGAEKISQGTKVLIKLEEWTDPKKDPRGTIMRVIGPRGRHDVEMTAIVLEQGFDTIFSKQVQNAARDIKRSEAATLEKELPKRRDFRNVTTFTIDPGDAKDFDDALSIREIDDDIEVGIHIADVSHYVHPNDVIDKEAAERGTSVYLVDRTIAMLPEILSNDVCSLNPNEDKLAFSAVFTISKTGLVKNQWFGETVINSNKRFTYEEAQDTILKQKGLFHKELRILNTLAKKLRTKRFAKGAIDFDKEEITFTLDQNGKPIKITPKKRLDTNKLIEEFMLLANREIAEHFYKLYKKLPKSNAVFIYRVHDMPDPDKLENLAIFLRAIGYELKVSKGNVSAYNINRLFEQVKGTPEENMVKTATIRSMAKAIYSTKNVGHFGLAFRYYTHFTSPIRRYPDLMVHRIMKRAGSGNPVPLRELKHYQQLAIQSSEREVAAVEAERASIKLKQAEYMSEHIGESFSATITGVTGWGIYVEDEKTQAEGMIRIQDLADDYYVLDKSGFRLNGRRTKKTYSLGDKIRVRLTGVDLESKTLDFVPDTATKETN